jgi:hypothetical protein
MHAFLDDLVGWGMMGVEGGRLDRVGRCQHGGYRSG